MAEEKIRRRGENIPLTYVGGPRRRTWVAWKILAFLKGKPGVRSTTLKDYVMEGLGEHSIPRTLYFDIISWMLQFGLIGQRGQRGAAIYYLTAYGDGALKAYEKHRPPEPVGDDTEDIDE